jgi:transposase-like protein
MRDEIRLIKKMDVNTLHRFDFQKCYNNWLHEHFILYKSPAPIRLKKEIQKIKILWIKDEFLLFRILSKDYLKTGYTCPKCGSSKGFIPTRYKVIGKVLETQKCVKVEKPRTLSCSECSFTFNPLSTTAYRNVKYDLRKIFFYQYISEEGIIDYPIRTIMRILDISYQTAKKIKQQVSAMEKPFSDEELNKYISNKTDEHPMIKVLLQLGKLKYNS